MVFLSAFILSRAFAFFFFFFFLFCVNDLATPWLFLNTNLLRLSCSGFSLDRFVHGINTIDSMF